MKTLIIDSDDYNRAGIETMFFPGGEPHVKLPDFSKQAQDGILRITFFGKLRTWEDVGFAALVLNALSAQENASTKLELYTFIPYFPGARQDKEPGLYPKTIQVMTPLLLQSGLNHAGVFDIHSAAAFETLCFESNCHVVNIMPDELPAHYFKSCQDPDGYVGVIAPDRGARDRAHRIHSRYHRTKDLITCEKERDQHTGRILRYSVPALRFAGHYLVVDDVCDGGATFNLLADAVRKDPNGRHSRLDLFVSHGIFSKGVGILDSIYDRVITTDSWCQIQPSEKLLICPLLPTFQSHLIEEYSHE